MSYGRDVHGVSAARGPGSPLCAATGETRITVRPSNGLNYDDRRKRFCKINENGKKTETNRGEKAKNTSERITRAQRQLLEMPCFRNASRAGRIQRGGLLISNRNGDSTGSQFKRDRRYRKKKTK